MCPQLGSLLSWCFLSLFHPLTHMYKNVHPWKKNMHAWNRTQPFSCKYGCLHLCNWPSGIQTHAETSHIYMLNLPLYTFTFLTQADSKQTDRPTDRPAGRPTGRPAGRRTGRTTDRHIHTYKRLAYLPTYLTTYRYTYMHRQMDK